MPHDLPLSVSAAEVRCLLVRRLPIDPALFAARLSARDIAAQQARTWGSAELRQLFAAGSSRSRGES